MPAVFHNLRRSISLGLFKSKDEEYHPRDEEMLDAQRRAEKSRDKERSRSEGAKLRAALAVTAPSHSNKSKEQKKREHHEHGLYEKKSAPSYSSLENATTSSSGFHRSAPVCRKLRENPKHVM